MIKELLKTFEYFPKQEKEEDRTLYVTNYFEGYEIRLVIFIDGMKHTSSHRVSNMEVAANRNGFDDDVIIRRICRWFNDKFGE